MPETPSFKRSHISPWIVFKHAVRTARHPWIASKLFMLEGEKTLFNALHPGRRRGEAGKIRQVSIRITDLCNLRCRTCGQWGTSGFLHGRDVGTLRRDEVRSGRYLDLLADVARNGHHPSVYLWGGEPMLYDGILDVMAGATALRMPVAIATNGTHLAGSARFLVDLPLFLLQVSIDGHRPELHNRLRPSTGNGDNFKQILEGLEAVNEMRRLLGRDLPLIASLTVISRDNAGHLEEIYDRFRDKVDFFVFYLSWWIDEEHAEAHEQDFARRFGTRPSLHRGWIGGWRPDDCDLIERQLANMTRRSRRRSTPPVTVIPPVRGVENLVSYYSDHEARFGYDQCVSIFQAVEINSNGDLSPCRDYHDYVVGNVKEKTISELWNSSAYRAFRRSLSREGLMPACSRCCGLMGY
ncbi:MAG: radical SAM protein [Deltaproteobacteria bacterium]|nr:radical SAM protein [Deltaproteobacteria bacterium]